MQEEERDQQKQELVQLRENSKKMKSALQSKQLLHDAQKKEIAIVLEKLKSEEQSRKSFQKVISLLMISFRYV
jgi:site-specific recombinase XerD